MRYTIDVTQRDIDQALTKDSARCVVATAIARSIPTATRIEVDVQSIRFTVGGERFAYVTPYTVSGYVVAFDAGDEIHPFKFRLDEDRAINVRRSHKTPAGKETNNAQNRARKAQKRADVAQERLTGIATGELPPPTPGEIALAKAKAKAAREKAEASANERDAVVAAYAGQKKSETDLDKPRAPATVYKKRSRHYGHRELRVNQASNGS